MYGGGNLGSQVVGCIHSKFQCTILNLSRPVPSYGQHKYTGQELEVPFVLDHQVSMNRSKYTGVGVRHLFKVFQRPDLCW
jgi:hypothetical protein